jgi:hypothetical protein
MLSRRSFFLATRTPVGYRPDRRDLDDRGLGRAYCEDFDVGAGGQWLDRAASTGGEDLVTQPRLFGQ